MNRPRQHPATECPHCHGDCLSAWKKLSVGPAGATPCRHCGQAVSVHWLPAMLLMLLSGVLPLLAGFGLAALIGPLSPGLLAAAIITGATLCLILLTWAYLRWVPLVPR